jgi:hypothetical protein
MSEQTKLGLKILGIALLLGALGDAIMRSTPWGLNSLVWVTALVIGLIFLAQSHREMLHGGGAWFLFMTILFSGALAWRDSPVLQALSCVAILVLLTLLSIRAQGGRVQLSGVTDYVMGGVVAGLNVLAGPLRVIIGYVRWSEVLNRQSSRRPLAVVRGVVLALPLLLLFGGLLAAADAVFATIMKRVFMPDGSIVGAILSHAPLFALFSWLVAGYLRGVLVGKKSSGLVQRVSSPQKLSRIDVGVMLGLLDLLFLVFVLVQLRYLFGGASLVNIKPGLTYAEYARSGFFELVTVAALALLLLLIAGWLLRRENPQDEQLFRALALIQVLLLFVIMASALERMVLYQREFGQTELRLYTTAFMGWLGLVFVWFVATVLRGHRERFAFGTLVAGAIALAFLYVVSPDRVIARANLARAAAHKSFDATYVNSLSADAVPTLIAGLPSLDPTDRCKVATGLLQNSTLSHVEDWRTWNWSREQAQHWLAKYRPLLDKFGSQQPCSNSQ